MKKNEFINWTVELSSHKLNIQYIKELADCLSRLVYVDLTD